MRKPDIAASKALAAVFPAASPEAGRDDAPVQLVCLALVLALVTLALRIVTIW